MTERADASDSDAGIRGGGAHAPTEWADLKTVPELVQRTALLIYRLTR